jgi:hypothetical protein
MKFDEMYDRMDRVQKWVDDAGAALKFLLRKNKTLTTELFNTKNALFEILDKMRPVLGYPDAIGILKKHGIPIPEEKKGIGYSTTD